MGRMAEMWQDQQEQENESGIDMHDCYHNHHPLEQVYLHTEKKNAEEGNFDIIGF